MKDRHPNGSVVGGYHLFMTDSRIKKICKVKIKIKSVEYLHESKIQINRE